MLGQVAKERAPRRGSIQLESAYMHKRMPSLACYDVRKAKSSPTKYLCVFAALVALSITALISFKNSEAITFLIKRSTTLTSPSANNGPPPVTSPVTASNIIIPLYMDPGKNGAEWLPLITAAAANPLLPLIVVLNPNNGPVTATTPDVNYKAGLARLVLGNPNIKFLGYVHQSYGARALANITADVNLWASWSVLYNIALGGIFFDESPSDKSSASLTYVRQANTIAKTTLGFAFPSVTTVQNPGTLPPAPYFAASQLSDITLILEDTYTAYLSEQAIYSGLAARYGTTTNAFAFALNSVPSGLSVENLQGILAQMMTEAGCIFLTDLGSHVDIYAAFGSIFGNFVAAVSLLTV